MRGLVPVGLGEGGDDVCVLCGIGDGETAAFADGANALYVDF